MKKEFTPNEWIYSHREIPNDEDGMYATQIHTEDGETIASISWYPKPKEKGIHDGKNVLIQGTYRDKNAQLISASPNMLEALMDLVRFCDENNVGAELDLAKYAIKKAIG